MEKRLALYLIHAIGVRLLGEVITRTNTSTGSLYNKILMNQLFSLNRNAYLEYILERLDRKQCY